MEEIKYFGKAGVCFYFENNDIDVWSGRHIDLDVWNYAARAAGTIERLIVINKTDQNLNPGGLFSVTTKFPALSGRVAKVVGPSEGHSPVSLWDFDHDVSWYAFGAAAGWRSELDNHSNIVEVTIPQKGFAAMHSMHVATTVLLHRFHVRGM